jgi:hypothetical protein
MFRNSQLSETCDTASDAEDVMAVKSCSYAPETTRIKTAPQSIPVAFGAARGGACRVCHVCTTRGRGRRGPVAHDFSTEVINWAGGSSFPHLLLSSSSPSRRPFALLENCRHRSASPSVGARSSSARPPPATFSRPRTESPPAPLHLVGRSHLAFPKSLCAP